MIFFSKCVICGAKIWFCKNNDASQVSSQWTDKKNFVKITINNYNKSQFVLVDYNDFVLSAQTEHEVKVKLNSGQITCMDEDMLAQCQISLSQICLFWNGKIPNYEV